MRFGRLQRVAIALTVASLSAGFLWWIGHRNHRQGNRQAPADLYGAVFAVEPSSMDHALPWTVDGYAASDLLELYPEHTDELYQGTIPYELENRETIIENLIAAGQVVRLQRGVNGRFVRQWQGMQLRELEILEGPHRGQTLMVRYSDTVQVTR